MVLVSKGGSVDYIQGLEEAKKLAQNMLYSESSYEKRQALSILIVDLIEKIDKEYDDYEERLNYESQ